LTGWDHKTVKRYVELAGELGQFAPPRRRARVTDDYRELIAGKVVQTRGRITARRLLRLVRAAGYEGSERSLRRAVAEEKRTFGEREAREGRVFRPWRSGPGEWHLCDWGSAGTVETPAGQRPPSFFSSVLGYSRHRQLTFSCSERFPALAIGLASNLELLGGVPAQILFDNPKTVTLRDVAGAAVLNPELVRLAAQYRFRPRTAAFYDAPSKGKVEAVVRFAKSDLIPFGGFGSLDEANAAARVWLAEVNSRPHSETKRPPVELLERERPLLRSLPGLRPAAACGERRRVDRLATVRFASARYSVPHRLVGATVEVAATDRDLTLLFDGVPVAHHRLLGPGECSIEDAHYPTPAPTGTRPLRPRTEPERAILRLGQEAESYCAPRRRGGPGGLTSESRRRSTWPRRAARRGRARRSHGRRGSAASLAAIWKRSATRSARRRQPRRRRPSRCGFRGCPRSPSARSTPTAKTAMAKPLNAELEAGLKRLKLRRVRELAPELLQTARTQRWRTEELLQTFVREEIASREAANLRRRMKSAGFPGHKTLDGFDPNTSELPRATFEFLRSLEWLERRDNLCLAGPAGPGSHCPPRRGHWSNSPASSPDT
jgi:transposase